MNRNLAEYRELRRKKFEEERSKKPVDHNIADLETSPISQNEILEESQSDQDKDKDYEEEEKEHNTIQNASSDADNSVASIKAHKIRVVKVPEKKVYDFRKSTNNYN